MDELISIIVPVYNAEKYIKHCVNSIVGQTYQNFELILVNDGSKDSSLELCQMLSEKDHRIQVFDRPNGGASAARNTGLQFAHGAYIVFIDIDDYVSKNYIENLYKAAKSSDYDIVQCDFERTSDIRMKVGSISYNQNDIKEITKIQALNQRMFKVSIWGKIYASYLFNNFKFREGEIYEDDASYYIFVDRAKRIAILNETLYVYYMSDNSVMRNSQKDKSTAFIQIYEERIQYFQAKNEIALLDGTYNRFCLVLMLTLSSALSNGHNLSDIEQFISLFKKYYPAVIRSANIRIKDKVMFASFNISPRKIGLMIGKLRRE